jgi:osmotically-inducible protein OsmY
MQLSGKLTFLEGFPSSQAKILVEDGTVYLMAKLTKAQTQQAVDVIKTMPDIQKLVKLVDYLD